MYKVISLLLSIVKRTLNKTSIISGSWFLVVICFTSPPAGKLKSGLSVRQQANLRDALCCTKMQDKKE
ncbi:hypothetical protein PRUPE_7G227400 [Prunus persica]|uniref:Uncharacterized protein n=1 Tax=Prunus persica TaxID=3760 RepID=A0A251NFH8_PRUPE|nr:hypothetical protein PRUPE_7G227400 [Prunus persica]